MTERSLAVPTNNFVVVHAGLFAPFGQACEFGGEFIEAHIG